MKLDSLMSYKTVGELTKVITITAIVVSAFAVVAAYVVLTREIKQQQKKVIVIDTKGQVYTSEIANAKEMRVFEYKDQVRKFYNLWYAFDENSYKKNIEKGLLLVGECGKELLNKYKDEDVERKLFEKNLKLDVTIKDIQIDMSTNPISGKIKGVQTIKRNKGSISRNLDCHFIIYDVDRSEENSHGCKIENWVIDSSDVITNTDTEQ
jgi:hypothetical protein